MRKKIKYLGIGLVAILLVASAFMSIKQVKATTIDFLIDTLENLTPSTLANHDIIFAPPNGVGAGQDILITFEAGFTFPTGGDAIDFNYVTVTDNGSPLTLGALASGSTWGVAVNSGARTITITSGTGTIAAYDTVEITIGSGTHKITNPDGVAGSPPYAVDLAINSGADTGTFEVTITPPGSLGVTGVVSQSITFSLGTYNIAFGQLSTSVVKTASHNLTLATNATNGIVVKVSGNTLTSGANTITACATNCSSIPGTKQFGLNLVANTTPLVGADATGTPPIAAAAANYNTANSFRFVTTETVASAAGPINTTSMKVSYIANISPITPAGNYTTSLTYTATATF